MDARGRQAEVVIHQQNLQGLLVRAKHLARHVWQHFSEDRCFEEAASLSYTSLLAMVPLLAVIFGIVAAFPVFAEWSEQLKSFLFTNLMPAAGMQLEQYLTTFLSSASSLTLPGTVTLILTALLLMFRIEVAFNRIWRVDKKRPFINRVVIYWAVLTLAPMLLGAAVAISFQSVLAPLATQDGQSLVWGRIGIFVLSWMVFALIFVLVPHRRVSFRHAFVGAFLSSVLFELAKIGFVAYVTNANYAAIYGALATLPIFLFWLYLVWVVVLLGASLAASLTTLDDYRRGQGGWPANRDFQLVFRLVGHLRQAQRDGLKLSQPELLAKEPMASERQLQDLLRGLEKVNIATRDEQGDWLLSRDTDDLSLADLYQSGNYHLPMISRESIPVDSAWDSEFEKVLQHVHAEGMAPMGRSLRKLYQLDDKDQ